MVPLAEVENGVVAEAARMFVLEIAHEPAECHQRWWIW